MWSSDSDNELTAAAAASSSTSSATTSPPQSPPPASLLHDTTRTRSHRRRRIRRQSISRSGGAAGATTVPEPEAEDVWHGAQWEAAWPARRDAKPVVLAAGPGGDDAVGRSRSLTDDDLEELKGCADLGFGFSYDEIPELRGTLPALELCYSMSQQRLLDDKPPQADHHPDAAAAAAAAAPPPPLVTNWKISSLGDSPDEVKARLKYWAQAVACTVRLCS